MSFASMPLYTGDYLRDTRHLTPLRHGVYLLALMHCWDSQGPMPLDEQECAGICNCRSADEVEALRYVLTKYFVKMDDGYYNKRMAEEVAKFARLSKKFSAAGLKSAEVRREKARAGVRAQIQRTAEIVEGGFNRGSTTLQAQAEPGSVSPSPSPSPSPSLKEFPPTPPKGDDPVGFAEFWAAYPRKVARVDAVRAFKKLSVDGRLLATMLAAIARQRSSDQWQRDGGKFVPNPATWLNHARWTDEVMAVQADGTRPDWAAKAGFTNRWEAENAGCFEHNAHQFAAGHEVTA